MNSLRGAVDPKSSAALAPASRRAHHLLEEIDRLERQIHHLKLERQLLVHELDVTRDKADDALFRLMIKECLAYEHEHSNLQVRLSNLPRRRMALRTRLILAREQYAATKRESSMR